MKFCLLVCLTSYSCTQGGGTTSAKRITGWNAEVSTIEMETRRSSKTQEQLEQAAAEAAAELEACDMNPLNVAACPFILRLYYPSLFPSISFSDCMWGS